jgi:nickel/cobalt transporter (NiCoT) family protein
MIATSAFTVFVLGLRHGADPDHLAAIDNVTRNAYERTPLLSRFVGTFFAAGHTVMVLAISAIVGFLGERFATHGAMIERIGTWVSIVVLIAIAVVNIRQVASGDTTRIGGAKTRLLPRALREGTNALLAIPIGLLFGFGFETSSQIATYAVAFGAGAGFLGAILVGAMFCIGMIVTDTLDSVLVHRLVSFRSAHLPKLMRIWIISVSALALIVAAYELLQVLGVQFPVSDIQVSVGLVSALGLVFVYVFLQTRVPAPNAPPTALLNQERTP